MATLKQGEPFGLDPKMIDKIDCSLALKRIMHDLRSDFIYAPHLAFIYAKCGDKLIAQVKSDLKDGKFSPSLPITIEVPKSSRMRVSVPSKRPGPNFSRPGSILSPHDRLLYQALADEATGVVDAKTDKCRSFSHRLAPNESASMFLPTRTCWSLLQKAMANKADSKDVRYVLKLDVVNFFASINQHTLINILKDYGYPNSLATRLELMLTSFTGERSSRGIIQGVYPSDLIGNFYMAPVDRFLDDLGIDSARYVDDTYVFVETVDAAERLMKELIPHLRSYDLALNEGKSVVMPKHALMTEEPDLEDLFAGAVEEVSGQIDDEEFDADYGFQSEWEEEEDYCSEDLELEATKILFDSVEKYPGHEENIERFCLPLFAKSGSDYALDNVMGSFVKRPAMAQIYASYLSKFLDEEDVYDFMRELVRDSSLNDWQTMWVIAALMQNKNKDDATTKYALEILKDANRHEALRAVAAIYIGLFGDSVRRKDLSNIYPSVSGYIQLAIYFSSLGWPNTEKSNAKAKWGQHSRLHELITAPEVA